MDSEPMIGIGGHHELAAPHRQQVIGLQDASDLFLSHHKSGALYQGSDAAVSMIAMRQSDPLDGVSQRHFRLAGRLLFPVAIEARSAHRRQFAHPLDSQLALRFPAADLVVNVVTPRASLFWRNPSTLRKALLKKLASKLRRPNSPSRLATLASSSRIVFTCGSSAAAGCPFCAASL